VAAEVLFNAEVLPSNTVSVVVGTASHSAPTAANPANTTAIPAIIAIRFDNIGIPPNCWLFGPALAHRWSSHRPDSYIYLRAAQGGRQTV